MKILHVYKTYFPDTVGGVEESIRQICMATSKLGVNPKIFTLSPNLAYADTYIDDIEVIRSKSIFRLASCEFGWLDSFRKFHDAVNKSDIIHFHFPWPFADILNLSHVTKKPKIMTYHSDIIRQEKLSKIYAPVMNYMLDQMDVIVATSPNYVKSSKVLSRKDINKKIKMIPLGISYPDDQSKASSDQYLVSNNEFILFIGALRYYKGLKYLIDAAPFVDADIVIAGSGGLESELRTYLKQKPHSNIKMIGSVDDEYKWKLLKECRAVVLPSHLRSEAFGVSLLEGAMFSKPLITCEINTGTSFVNLDEVTGKVARPADAQSLAKSINYVLMNARNGNEMGNNARNRYEQYFTADKLGQNYIELYQSLV